jgi:hypothetical protein
VQTGLGRCREREARGELVKASSSQGFRGGLGGAQALAGAKWWYTEADGVSPRIQSLSDCVNSLSSALLPHERRWARHAGFA